LLTSGGPLPRLRAKLRDLADSLRYEDAARLRDRVAALEHVVAALAGLDGLRAAELVLLAPALEAGYRRAFFVAHGRIAATRTIPPGRGSALELEAGIAESRAQAISFAPEDADELLLVGSFLRRPPPELTVLRFEDVVDGYAGGDGQAALGA
jgi:excinuclease UvrABC nuclease subunit